MLQLNGKSSEEVYEILRRKGVFVKKETRKHVSKELREGWARRDKEAKLLAEKEAEEAAKRAEERKIDIARAKYEQKAPRTTDERFQSLENDVAALKQQMVAVIAKIDLISGVKTAKR